MRAAVLALPLLACAPAPEVDRSAEAAGLRDCATITHRCAGVAALAARLPEICADGLCFLSHAPPDGREVLGAMDLGGAVCGFRAKAGTRPVAILGLWTDAADGTRHYTRARFLGPGAADTIAAPRAFAAACADLAGDTEP